MAEKEWSAGEWREEEEEGDEQQLYQVLGLPQSEEEEERADDEDENAEVEEFAEWMARARERERCRAEQVEEQCESNDEQEGERTEEHWDRGVQWFSYPFLPNSPAARRGHSATLVPYSTVTSPTTAFIGSDLEYGGTSATSFSPSTTTTTTSALECGSIARDLSFLSLLERQIREEQSTHEHTTMRALREEERQRKRQRRDVIEHEVEEICRRARQGDRILVFGGNSRRQYRNDLHVLDIEHEGKPILKWTPIVHGVDTSGQLPDPRSHHTATLIGQTLWIFGGVTEDRVRGSRALNDLWALDLWDGTWRSVAPYSKLLPAPRHGHTAVAVGHRIVIYGGCDTRKVLDDTWEFDTVHYQWRRLSTRFAPGQVAASAVAQEPQDQPYARYFHTAAYIGMGRMLIYGGRDQDHVFNDVLVLDLTTLLWYCAKSSDGSAEIGKRAGHTMSLLSAALRPEFMARVIIYGGWDGSTEDGEEVGAEEDVYLLSIRFDEDRSIFTAACHNCSSTITSDGPAPTGRDCHTAVLAETAVAQPRLFVFGGTDGDYMYLSDTHALDFGSLGSVRGGVASLFKLALRYVTTHPARVWDGSARSEGHHKVELTDACLETVAREMLFYASGGGALLSG